MCSSFVLVLEFLDYSSTTDEDEGRARSEVHGPQLTSRFWRYSLSINRLFVVRALARSDVAQQAKAWTTNIGQGASIFGDFSSPPGAGEREETFISTEWSR